MTLPRRKPMPRPSKPLERGAQLKRTELKRGESVLRSVQRIKPISKKRRKENRERRRNLIAEFGPNPECYIRWDERCRGWADNGHEILKRSRGGSITDVSGIVPACQPCNGAVEDFPDEAIKRGWAIHSWDRDNDSTKGEAA